MLILGVLPGVAIAYRYKVAIFEDHASEYVHGFIFGVFAALRCGLMRHSKRQSGEGMRRAWRSEGLGKDGHISLPDNKTAIILP